jgi:hypothetical protein
LKYIQVGRNLALKYGSLIYNRFLLLKEYIHNVLKERLQALRAYNAHLNEQKPQPTHAQKPMSAEIWANFAFGWMLG